MEERFAIRRREMMAEAELYSDSMSGLLDRLGEFVRPFAVPLTEPEQRKHTEEYVSGLLSGLEHKTGEAIAYLHDQERQGIQKFIGHVPWDHRPLVSVLAAQVGQSLGEPDGVIVFDPSGFGKKGTQSVGVARQWCGRLGKVENCQVGIYLGYVSRRDHALVDFRLYLPKEWATDRKRCTKAGVPKTVRVQTRHEQALEMLAERGPQLPPAWVTGDDEMGRSSDFRQKLRGRNEHYVPAVPSNTLIRDREAEPPRTRAGGGVRRCRSGERIVGLRPDPRRPGRRSRSATGRRGRWSRKPCVVGSRRGPVGKQVRRKFYS